MRGRISNKRFDCLMRAYRAELLMEEGPALRGQVPESTDRAAERAFRKMEACIASGSAVPAGRAAVKAAAKAGAAAKILAVIVGGSVLIGAGSYAASPAVRERVGRLFSYAHTDRAARRSPGEYVIPSPGEGFSVTDELVSEYMHGCWFTMGEREVLVQIAEELPPEAGQDGGAEVVTVGGAWGTYAETGDTLTLILHDGDVLIRIETLGADREGLLAYAAALLAANE